MEDRLTRLVRSLRRDPADLAGWVRLAEWVRRAGRGPEAPDAPWLGGGMLAALGQDPGRGDLLEVGLELLGLHPGPGTGFGAPGSFWDEAEAERAVRRGGVRIDRISGLPLEVRRTRDGAAMRLVPAGSYRLGEAATLAPGGGLYLDSLPVDLGRYGRFLRETGRAAPRPWAAQVARGPEMPAVFVGWHEAAAYAAWVGGQLPRGRQWEAAARGVDGRVFPWGSMMPTGPREAWPLNAGHPEPARAADGLGLLEVAWARPGNVSPLGVRDLVGNCAEWCRDRRGDLAASKGGDAGLAPAACAAAATAWTGAAVGSWRRGFRVAITLGADEEGPCGPRSEAV